MIFYFAHLHLVPQISTRSQKLMSHKLMFSRLSCQKKQMLLNVLHTKKASNTSNTSQFQIRQVWQGHFLKFFCMMVKSTKKHHLTKTVYMFFYKHSVARIHVFFISIVFFNLRLEYA